MKTKLKTTIDPFDIQYLEKPLWIICGAECFPTIIACKLRDHGRFGICIWGYSVYKGKPDYRTLGQRLETWMTRASNSIVYFFDNQENAIAVLNGFITPKKTQKETRIKYL